LNTGYSTRIDMTGQRFGRWAVLEYAYNDKGNQAHWRCRCDCGTVSVVAGRTLRAGLSKSCGCYKPEYTRKQKTIPHKIVGGVECKRCRVCKEWKDLSKFSKSSDRWDGLDKDCKECLSRDRVAKKEKRRTYIRDWTNNKYATDVNYRIKSSIQARIRGAIKNNYKAASTAELVGCSIEYLKYYLEFQFKDGMSWGNYGEWHIDHRIPCAAFDLSDPEQQKICFHYTNLQPLWMLDNVRKGDKIF
jgi:hypothetical protein